MDKMKLEEMAKKAFENVKGVRDRLFSATENAIECKWKLEADEGNAAVDGKFDGKNAETRKAQAVEFFKDRYQELRQLENAERSARYHYDMAQIDVDTVKTLLRIAELP